MKPVKNHPTPRPHRQLVRDDALAGDLRAIAQPNPDELALPGCWTTLLNYIVAAYLIVVGRFGLFGDIPLR